MYIKYIAYIFLTAIRLHICDSWTLPNRKKIKNNENPIYKISSIFNMVKKILKFIFYAFIANQMFFEKKFNGFANKNSKF